MPLYGDVIMNMPLYGDVIMNMPLYGGAKKSTSLRLRLLLSNIDFVSMT